MGFKRETKKELLKELINFAECSTRRSFIISNTDYQKCPAPDKPEFAFIGRSNVGKSSLINMMTARKGLAKTSGSPWENTIDQSLFD